MPSPTQESRLRTGALLILVACASMAGPLAAQTKPALPADNRIQLAVRQPAPANRIVTVAFSQDERLVAAADSGTAFVYDLDAAIEIRRIAVESPNPFSLPLGFSSSGDELYLQDGPSLKLCPLERDVACREVPKPILGLLSTATHGLTLGRGDLLIGTADDGVPAFMHVPTARVWPLRETVASGDREKLTWTWAAFDDASHDPTQVAIVGSIDRESRADRTTEEWRVSVFDMLTAKPLVSYLRLPITVTMLDFATNGDVYVCGGEPGAELGDMTTPRLYNVTKRSFQNIAAVKPLLSPSFAFACGGSPEVTPPSPVAGGFWFSPSMKRVVQQGLGGTGGIMTGRGLFVAPVDRSGPPAALTAGDTVAATRVEFTANPMVLASYSSGTQLWDLSSGQVLSAPVNIHYSRDGIFASWLLQNGPSGPLQIVVQDRREGNTIANAFPVTAAPRWFAIVDRKTLVVQTEQKLTVHHPGGITDLDCEAPSDRRSPTLVKPEIDLSGTYLSARCATRRAYVTWSLRPLREVNAVPFPTGEVFVRTSDPTRVLALESSAGRAARLERREPRVERLLNFVTGESTPLPGLRLAEDARQFDTLTAATITPDGSTLVLAFNSVTNAGDRVEWRRLSSPNTIVKSVAGLPRILQMTASSTGAVAVLTDIGIRLYSPDGAESIHLITGVSGPASGDWLAFTDDGMFDGTAAAMQWVGLKWSDREPLLTLDVLFNELYRPGLLRMFGSPENRSVASIPFSLYARIPGLKLLLQQEELRPAAMGSGEVALCVRRPELFNALLARRQGLDEPGFVRDNDPGCPNRIVIRGAENPAGLVAALSELKIAGVRTPWDGQKIPPGPSVTHVVTFAVEATAGLSPMPTAVVSAQAVERAFSQNAPGGRVRVWSREIACGSEAPRLAAAKLTIVNCLRQVAAEAAPEDMVVVFLAGHGGAAPGTELFYYYPADYTQAAGLRSALSAADMADAVRALRAQRLLLIVDTCDAGAAVEPLASVVTARMRAAAAQSGPQTSQANQQGAVLIGASTAAETAATTREVNPFVTLLIDALKAAQGTDGVTWSHGLSDAIRKSTFRVGGLPATAVAVGADFAIAGGTTQR